MTTVAGHFRTNNGPPDEKHWFRWHWFLF